MQNETGQSTFRTYAELRAAHSEFSKRYKSARLTHPRGVTKSADPDTENDQTDETNTESDVEAFVEKAEASGVNISRDDERRAAQTILDYWSAELINSSAIGDKDWSPSVLAPCPENNDHFEDPHAADISPEVAKKRRQARDLIRLSGVVRRWRDSGESSDYLLSGDALNEAEDHMDLDPGIREIVVKSRVLERRRTNHRWIGFSTIITVLTVLCIALLILWREAEEERGIAEKARTIAEVQSNLAHVAREDAEAQANEARRARQKAEEQAIIAQEARDLAEQEKRSAETQTIDADKLKEQAERNAFESNKAFEIAQSRVRELETAQSQLDLSIQVIAKAVADGAVQKKALPRKIQNLLNSALFSRYVFPPLRDPFLTGFHPEFLGFPIRRPKLSQSQESTAFLGGGSLHYVNYSIVFDRQKRSALYAAGNLDRSQLQVLPRVAGKTLRDPRVPEILQPDLPEVALSGNSALLIGGEIAWGPFLEDTNLDPADRLSGVTKVFPNTIPAQVGLNRWTWTEVNRWILTEHNQAANNVNIFAGPIFRADDPGVEGVAMPQRYWKIAVSRQATNQFYLSGSALRVDAFIVKSGDYGGGAVDRGGNRLFVPDDHRISIKEIEALTGLVFDDRIRQADASSVHSSADLPDASQVLADSVRLLNSEQTSARASVVGQIVNAFGPKGLDPAGQKKIVTAILENLGRIKPADLTTAGLYNYTFVLSQVPFEIWDLAGWEELKINALNAARKLESLGRRGALHIAPKSRENINVLKGNLGAETTGLETVAFKFATITRAQAVETSFVLQDQGWDIPGEQRTHAASGLNEVAYGDELDQAAAEILAEDLQLLRPDSSCCKVVRDQELTRGFLEIRISE